MPDRILPIRFYLLDCLILLLLLAANVALAHIDLHAWNTVALLLIAAVQAAVVGTFVMHLRWAAPMTRLVALAALLWLAILMVGTLDDVLTRGWLPVPGK